MNSNIQITNTYKLRNQNTEHELIGCRLQLKGSFKPMFEFFRQRTQRDKQNLMLVVFNPTY